MIQAIIFDFFGVLVGRGFAETYRMAGGDPLQDAQFIEDTLGQANLGLLSEAEFYQMICRRLDITQAEFQAAMAKAELPNYELLDYIADLHKTYKTAVLSNANIGVLERKIDPTILKSHFDAVVISAEVGKVKPDPDIYQLAADKLSVDPEGCIFVDDHAAYCQAAEAKGMRSIVYTSFGQFRADLLTALGS